MQHVKGIGQLAAALVTSALIISGYATTANAATPPKTITGQIAITELNDMAESAARNDGVDVSDRDERLFGRETPAATKDVSRTDESHISVNELVRLADLAAVADGYDDSSRNSTLFHTDTEKNADAVSTRIAATDRAKTGESYEIALSELLQLASVADQADGVDDSRRVESLFMGDDSKISGKSSKTPDSSKQQQNDTALSQGDLAYMAVQADNRVSGRFEQPVANFSNSSTPTSAKIKVRHSDTAVVHRIRKGDTLWAIARRYLHDPRRYQELAKFNNIKNPNRIRYGTVIKIPPGNA